MLKICVVCGKEFETNYKTKNTDTSECKTIRKNTMCLEYRRNHTKYKTYPRWETSKEWIQRSCRVILENLPAKKDALKLAVLRSGIDITLYGIDNVLKRLRDCGDIVYNSDLQLWVMVDKC